MRSTLTILLAGILSGLAAISARGGEIIVAPTGRDTNPGTFAAPVQTLARAQALAREDIARDPEKSVVVTLSGGVYRLETPLEFGIADGGSPNRRVEWRAAPGERVVISGGVPVTDWRAVNESLWAAPLPRVAESDWKFRELYVNGSPASRASHPNEGFLRVQAPGSDRRTLFAIAPRSFPQLTPGAGVELVFLHDWSISRIPVLQADSATGMVRLASRVGRDTDAFAIDAFEPNPRFKLENDPTFLDAPGEWIIDEAEQQVLYRPRADERIDNVTAVAPLAEALMIARGDPEDGQPIQNLHFVGLEFQHVAWHPPAAGFAGIQATFHELRDGEVNRMSTHPIPAAVTFELAESCSVTNSVFRNLGGSGIAFGSRCRACSLARSFISNVAANGVNIGEDTSRNTPNGPWWIAAAGQVNASTHIHDCVIEHCGTQYYGGIGIWAGITAGTVIERNWLRDLPYSGVSIGWRWTPEPTPARDNHIKHNRIERVIQKMSDGGGIYTLGNQPRMAILGNVIRDIPESVGRSEANGLFLDEGTTGVNIQANAILNVFDSPIRFNHAGANTVRENLLQTRPGVPAIKYGATPEGNITLIRNAIVTGPLPGTARIPPAGPSPSALEYFQSSGGSR